MTSMRSTAAVQGVPPPATTNGPQHEAKENGGSTITFTMDAKEGEEMKKKIVEYSPQVCLSRKGTDAAGTINNNPVISHRTLVVRLICTVMMRLVCFVWIMGWILVVWQRRYVRFNEIIGKGAYKMVYRAYDTKEGLLVAWNTITLSGLPKHEKVRIMHEVRLLEQLDNGNIISFFGSWVNREKEEVVFITEILSSGSLKDFIRKVQVIRWKIIKRWCRQILKGLEYLHGHEPPIIHRDLKCDNIFINGSSGDLRIGDLGLSTYITGRTAPLSVLGTPEFMAPELYDEQYDVKVDIYAFGMCVLEMVSKETPYSECANAAQIYKRVTSQVPPQVLFRVRNEKAREFILACLQQDPNARPSVSELLQHPFLLNKEEEDEEVVLDPPGKVPEKQSPQHQGHDGGSPRRFGEKPDKPQMSSLRPPDVSTNHPMDSSISGASPSVAASSSVPQRRGSSPAPPMIPSSTAHDADHQPLERRGSLADKLQKETPRNAGGERKMPSSGMGNRVPSTSSDLDHSQPDDHHAHHHTHHHAHHHLPPAPPASQHPRRPPISHAGDADGMGHNRRPSGGVPQGGLIAAHDTGDFPPYPASFSRNNSDSGDQASDMHYGYQSPAEAGHHSDVHPSPGLKVVPPPTSTTTTNPSPMAAPTTVQVRSSGQQGGKNVLCLVIRAKIQGKLRDIEFDFHLHDDDAYTVAQEMVTELGLPSTDLKDIAETIIKLAASARGARRPGIPVAPTSLDASRPSPNSADGGVNMAGGYNAKGLGLLEPPLLRSYSTSHLPVNNMTHMNSHHNSTATSTTSQQQSLEKSTSLPHDNHHSQSMIMMPTGASDHSLPSALGGGGGHQHHRTRTTGHIDMSSVNGHGPPPLHGVMGGAGAPASTTSGGMPWDHAEEARVSPQVSVNDEEEMGMSRYSLPKEEELTPDDVEDAAYMKLRGEYEKNLNRVVKVHSLRMDNLRKAKEEKEECYRKQLERHSKDMADFEKKVRTAEKEQMKRLKQLEEDWRQTRADYRGKRRPGAPPRLEGQEQQAL